MNLQKEKDKIISRIGKVDDEKTLWAISKIMGIDSEKKAELTEEQKSLLDTRNEAHNNGSSKSYTRKEARKEVIASRK